ncbi:uncharacterized protein LOC111867028 isoform X2 [Cryptotermes secundus]|uniref:uncharacterized protein LOC111867028 isoform X2 n=1 Tax=Cryptotermes secundus TaxID=105785 RepID=UPI000CD7B062|nr:uncharacterized protein LOC111867028 isoform X2 [Cryptotermes secundus]
MANQASCVVSMCDFGDYELITVLSCMHQFHAECIDTWREIQGRMNSDHLLTTSSTQTSDSKCTDDVSLQGIYKLSHSWIIVQTILRTNSFKCVHKVIIKQLLPGTL